MSLRFNEEGELVCSFCPTKLEEKELPEVIEDDDIVVCHTCKEFIEEGARDTIH